MKLWILIYLAIGILSNLFGPLAKKLNEAIRDVKKASAVYSLHSGRILPEKKKVIFEIVCRFFVVTLYPIIYVLLAIYYFQSKSSTEEKEIKLTDYFLYFSKMGGEGVFICKDCGYNEEILSFRHAAGSPYQVKIGHQCQSCGKFDKIELDNPKEKICECGGELHRNKPLFCPKCKTHNVAYKILRIS